MLVAKIVFCSDSCSIWEMLFGNFGPREGKMHWGGDGTNLVFFFLIMVLGVAQNSVGDETMSVEILFYFFSPFLWLLLQISL